MPCITPTVYILASKILRFSTHIMRPITDTLEMENLRPVESYMPSNNVSKLPIPVKMANVNPNTRRTTLEDKTNNWRTSEGTLVIPPTNSGFTSRRHLMSSVASSSLSSSNNRQGRSVSATSVRTRPAVNSINMAEKIAQLEQQLESYQTELDNTTETKNKLQSEVNSLRTDRSEWELERRKLEDAYNDLKSQYDEDIGSLSSRYSEELAKYQQTSQAEIKSLNMSHSQALETYTLQHQTRLENALNEQRNEIIEQYAAEKHELQEKLHKSIVESQDIKSRLSTEINNFQNELTQIRNAFNQQNVEAKKYREQMELQEIELSQIKQEKLSMEISQSTQTQKMNEMEDLLTAKNDELRSAVEIRDTLSAKLRKEEIIRRKLHNKIQELKGNIRVFCRVRPALTKESNEKNVQMAFPDEDMEGQQITVAGPTTESALGNVSTKTYSFQFDKVFAPASTNSEIFEEISQLIQSALDGYNVSIFAYGQTGSGKTYTMSEEQSGMIPRAVNMIFEEAKSLRENGWNYELEGQFVEIYNETLNDLLATTRDSTGGKLEIRHDQKTMKTTVVGLTSVLLDSPSRVASVLKKASEKRVVASTMSNERSSRSHSVFMMKIKGQNSISGRSCESTLNLIDLAGSERLSASQATGDRLKETQAINKSLSSLGDVICALASSKDGKPSAHVPFRNSKLTYLLQFSLSGDSKTLMFVNVSPLEAHANETLSSLRFATKVNDVIQKK